MRPHSLIPALLVVVITGAGCSDNTGPGQEDCPANLSSVTMTATVRAGSVAFDWTPSCPVAAVLVEEARQGSDVWWISAAQSAQDWGPPASANIITPPVTYGQNPGGLYFYGPQPLTGGESYSVAIFRVLPSGSTASCIQREGAACVVAVESFTR